MSKRKAKELSSDFSSSSLSFSGSSSLSSLFLSLFESAKKFADEEYLPILIFHQHSLDDPDSDDNDDNQNAAEIDAVSVFKKKRKSAETILPLPPLDFEPLVHQIAEYVVRVC
ncbi:17543_t:CDS:2 [Racocetra persica]|uniref:17543_t:CDS:1 n=1 Tax=Racocetra persica TaxID=160502 RepID=A0ACA9KQK7_9GLOM|nr:17543_t:CDS:2 [Racocetra persica]